LIISFLAYKDSATIMELLEVVMETLNSVSIVMNID